MKRVVLVLAGLLGPGAPAGAADLAPADRAFFEGRVRPLLVGKCFNCHSTKAGKKKGGLLLDSGASVLKGGKRGPAVVAGRPGKSLLIRAVRRADERLRMPPAGKLEAHEVAALEEWVRRGAPYPEAEPPAKAAPGAGAGRNFWSFRPLKPSALPATKDSTWARRRIDSFILAELERRGLGPSPEASRRVLIRRVYFDLVGLPPAPEEMEAFVHEKRPDAYERLVDRLLASPAYGERWGRFWLDLTRYADVLEPWAENKGAPYLYRDWVVRALNDDLPYDLFVRKQLAADLLPGAKPDDLPALGFLGLSPTYWKELKLAPDAIKGRVADEWEERIGALAGTFLGLTAACARCHDHKYDPITVEDYYALAGVLASVRPAGRPMLPDGQARRVQAARAKVEALGAEVAKLKGSKPTDAAGKKRVEELRAEAARLKATPGYDAPLAPGVVEASLHVLPDGPDRTKLEYRPGEARDVAVQPGGNPARPGRVVPRRFLAVLSRGKPAPFREGSGRRELAESLVTDAGHLSARVIVNRVWQHHFGRGLVTTPSDFGAQGARPSHPELLDDLSARFVASGWSLKWLHREIVLSSAYRQSSGQRGMKKPITPPSVDPDNRLLWRMNRRRLEVEAWRDAMLAVGGTLSRQQGGPPRDLADPANDRRTVYGLVKRRELHDLLRLNDFPDPTAHSAGRVPTTTPLQQLLVLNSPFMKQRSKALAGRLTREAPDGAARVRRAYALLYGRAPTARESALAAEFLRGGTWEEYAQVLLGSNEFLFVD